MSVRIQTPEIYVWTLRAISLLAPKDSRLDWRREWEAEILSHWLLLKKWKRLTAACQLDLFKRVLGSIFDVLCFQRRRVSLVLIALNTLVSLAIGFGAIQHFIFDGVGERQLQPSLLGLGATFVSIMYLTTGIALFRQWPTEGRLINLTGMLSILLHVYGVLPPHRNMGFFVLMLGAGYGLLMVIVFWWNEKRNLVW